MREQQFLRLLQRCDCLLMRDGGEVIQKIAKRMTAREVVDERLEGNASSHEDRCASENLGIDVNDAFVASQAPNRNRICWPFAYRAQADEAAHRSADVQIEHPYSVGVSRARSVAPGSSAGSLEIRRYAVANLPA